MLIIPNAISSFPITHPTPDILIPLLIATGYIRFHPNLDLRKLIKHEERLAENAKANNSSSRSLHQRGTVSSRAKLTGDKDKENTAPPPSSCPCPQKEKESKTDQDNQREVGGAGFADLARIFKEKLLMEASVPPDAVKDLNPAKSLATGKRRSRSKTRKDPPLSSGGESDPSVNPTRMQRRRRSKSQPRSASRGAFLGEFQSKPAFSV